MKKIILNLSGFIRIDIDNKKTGAAALIVLIISIAITAVLIGGFSFISNKEIAVVRQAEDSNLVLQAAESGIEEIITRLRAGGVPPSPLTLSVGSATTTVTTTSNGNQYTITSVGVYEGLTRTIQSTISLNTTEADFIYGVQVGDGGLTMGASARINGSVYSDGDIIGSTNARITGDAFVAIGTPPTADQSWTAQNADFNVGTAAGSIITIVDSGGDVGEYGSIVLGSDGFARISYYDASNKDLKFVRCTNIDCTTKNITTVDTSDGQYSSMVLGSDGFARIAYYDGDLNFARCLDADCSTKNITEPDSAGDTGQYTSIVLGSDGFARISYIDISNRDLKFVRCTNADCTAKSVATVDSVGTIHRNTSLAIGSDGFARISYMDDGNDDLKFVRCTNADCTTKNITTVDGNEGSYSSLELGSDGFGRISYFNGSDLAFVRCTNDDCTTKSINTLDTTGTVGQYTSLILGSDGFGRISYYDSTNGDLKFARCLDDACSPPSYQVDVAQSFKTTVTQPAIKAELYLKKIGVPANATLRLIKDSGGSPSTSGSDVLTTATINASQVTSSYGWLTTSFSSNPSLTANTTYWLVFDAVLDNSNYFIWGGDSAAGYNRGSAKRAQNYTTGGWVNITGDLDFKLYIGGVDNKIDTLQVDGNANAHIVQNSTVGGSVNGYTFTNGTVGGNISANAISSCTIGGNASYNTKNSCTIGGNQTSPNTPPADPPHIALPISDATIAQWKVDAAAGGQIVGDYSVASNVSLGPKEITGNLNMITNNVVLTVTGTIYVRGNIDIDNGATIRCGASYGSNSCIVLADGWIHVKNNGDFQGSGQPNSYIMLLSTLACTGVPGPSCGHHDSAIDLHNNATGAIFYASSGLIYLHNNVNVSELVGYKIYMDNSSLLIYQGGLANAQFSSGPSAGWSILSWKEL